MDTPERNQMGTPISKIEESPFSNFINSLSPINPIKTLHVSQTFSSLSFTSPPSVFTSPHVSLQKESRFLQRHQVSDLAKPQFTSSEGNKGTEAEQGTSADKWPDNSTNEQLRWKGAPGSEVSAEPLSDVSKLAAELQRQQKCDSGNPDCKIATSSVRGNSCEPETSRALVPFVQDSSMRGPYGAELTSREMNHDDEDTCDWQSLMSGSTDLFVFDSPTDTAILREPLQKSPEEPHVLVSLFSRFSPDDAKELSNSYLVGPAPYNDAHGTIENSTQPIEPNVLKQIDKQRENLEISSLNEYVSGDPDEHSGNEPFSNLHRGMRRRCLIFEMPRAKQSMDGVLISSYSSSSQNEEKVVSDNNLPITPAGCSSRRILPGIGLYLNAVSAASKDCRISQQEMLSPSSQEPLMKSAASFEVDIVPAESGAECMEDSSQASTYLATEELNPNSPKKKRRKFENIGEGEACKRCNCKKSKCLKLYCECFAAGVYCVEPCSCQDCFNKPIHEDTVLATRKQIESRNPLAFAPKVIRASDSGQELGEDSTRTPASARHKRGCNCKKSNCLKKYCECYQGGVGCSINCRCEGCKNAFGRKDGSTLLGTEVDIEEAQASEKSTMDKSSDPPTFLDEEDHTSEYNLPATPLRLLRPSVPLPTSSKGKPPRSSLVTKIGLSSYLHPVDGPGRSTFLRSQIRIEKPLQGVSGDEIPAVLQNGSPPNSDVKISSPNSKRISPPHHDKEHSPVLRSSRKLILQSIPSFPSLTPRR